jgi:hypothetical protein
MRRNVTPEKLRRFMHELAAHARSGGNVFFTGGATALLLGLREQTIDLDLKFDPEPQGVFEAISRLKNTLDVNVELASPGDFIPVAPDWKERSLFIDKIGDLQFFHFDLQAQILAKIERGYPHDLQDARDLLSRQRITSEQLCAYFAAIKPLMARYPALDREGFERKMMNFLGGKTP